MSLETTRIVVGVLSVTLVALVLWWVQSVYNGWAKKVNAEIDMQARAVCAAHWLCDIKGMSYQQVMDWAKNVGQLSVPRMTEEEVILSTYDRLVNQRESE